MTGDVRVLSVDHIDYSQAPCTRHVADRPVEPPIDDDGLGATRVEMALELACYVLVADRHGDRALHDAENGRQRFRTTAMDDREATLRTETRMLKLGGYVVG